MKIGKKVLALTLLTSMLMGGGGLSKAYADELTDPYIPRIRSGEIKPPQYMDNDVSGPNPSVDDWIKSVESQGEASKIDGAIKWKRTQKEFKIKKLDPSGKPVKGVVFSAYNTKEDVENNRNSIGTVTSDANGDVKFTGLPLYYGFYVKETSVPEGYAMGKEIIPVYRDNGVRFIGEKKASDFKVAEAKEGQDLNKYLQGLLRYGVPFRDQIDWLVFNDNGVEKLVPKKSLTYSVSWDQINNAGLRNGNKTVTIDGKTYKIRLMRAYNDEADPTRYTMHASEKGSEWNRMILPLIGIDGLEARVTSSYDYINNPYGRFGGHTHYRVEQNMPILANYTWWRDFRGNKSYRSPNYPDEDGTRRWMQNVSRFNPSCRAYRGYADVRSGAADSDGNYSFDTSPRFGWQPVLEVLD